MLVAPVRALLRRAREVEVEVRRPASRSSRAGQDDAKDVAVLVLGDQLPEREQLARRLGREPPPHVAARGVARRAEHVEAADHLAQLPLEDEKVVAPRLDPHEERVEGHDIDAPCVEPALERLDERRPRARERVEDPAADPEVPGEQRLDELRDELAQVRVEPVEVLRPLPLGEVAL